MKKYLPCLCMVLLALSPAAQEETPAPPEPRAALQSPAPSLNPIDEQRRQIIRYGTDSEIAALIKTLRGEQAGENDSLDGELLALAQKTKNHSILTGIFSFFGDREKRGLEERALEAVGNRDYETSETVNAAIDYLGKVRAAEAGEPLRDILNGEETRFLSAAVRSLGRCAGKEGAEETAEYLVDYYTNRDVGDENRRLIITALGDTGARECAGFLVSIAENEDERAPLRMSALEALAKTAAPEGLPALIKASSARDPNVRSTAIASLGPFSGEEADTAIVEAFRDSYYRTRIAAAKAAGERKLRAAVPYLRFRSENDDVPAVRDEAIKAMGAIGGGETEKILEELFKERKNSDRIRINAAEMLLAGTSGDYASAVIAELDEAKTKNQTALYNGFLRILGGAKSEDLKSLARRFFAGGGVVEKSYALDICLNNDFRDLAGEVRSLTDPKHGSLSRKSLALLEKWGLPAAEEPPAAATAGEEPPELQEEQSSEAADSAQAGDL
ncbi:MAG: HEAT repeat domain-containing protein [Spirochaetaceae bacterium]|nr:HEAT repeat domain-containing protein [Spirochaetaceae bacterium]